MVPAMMVAGGVAAAVATMRATDWATRWFAEEALAPLLTRWAEINTMVKGWPTAAGDEGSSVTAGARRRLHPTLPPPPSGSCSRLFSWLMRRIGIWRGARRRKAGLVRELIRPDAAQILRTISTTSTDEVLGQTVRYLLRACAVRAATTRPRPRISGGLLAAEASASSADACGEVDGPGEGGSNAQSTLAACGCTDGHATARTSERRSNCREAAPADSALPAAPSAKLHSPLLAPP